MWSSQKNDLEMFKSDHRHNQKEMFSFLRPPTPSLTDINYEEAMAYQKLTKRVDFEIFNPPACIARVAYGMYLFEKRISGTGTEDALNIALSLASECNMTTEEVIPTLKKLSREYSATGKISEPECP